MNRGFIAAMAVIAMTAARAGEPVDTALARVVAACTPDSAFGMPFGATTHRRFVDPTSWPPLGMITLKATPNSSRLHLAEGMTELSDAATAKSVAARAATAAVAEGRFRKLLSNDPDRYEFALGTLRLEIIALGRSAYVSCSRTDLQQRALDELFGRVRLEQPTAPTLPVPPRPSPDVCTEVGLRAPFVARFEVAMQPMMEYMSAASAYAAAQRDWFMQQMDDKKAWTVEERKEFAVGLMTDPEIGAQFSGGMGVLLSFMDSLKEFGVRRKAGDEAGACAHGLLVLEKAEGILASSLAQSRRIEDLLKTEATRRGVDLD